MSIGVRKTVCKFDSVGRTLEKEAKLQLVTRSALFFIHIRLSVANFGAPAPPFGFLSYFSVTYFHARVVKACSFCETFDNEFDLSLEPLAGEVKPSRCALGVHFLGELDLVGGGGNFLD